MWIPSTEIEDWSWQKKITNFHNFQTSSTCHLNGVRKLTGHCNRITFTSCALPIISISQKSKPLRAAYSVSLTSLLAWLPTELWQGQKHQRALTPELFFSCVLVLLSTWTLLQDELLLGICSSLLAAFFLPLLQCSSHDESSTCLMRRGWQQADQLVLTSYFVLLTSYSWIITSGFSLLTSHFLLLSSFFLLPSYYLDLLLLILDFLLLLWNRRSTVNLVSAGDS